MIGVAASKDSATEFANGAGGVWEYISPSRLNCWIACPLKFKLRYLDGIRTPTNANLFLGKQVHSGLEVANRHRMLGIALSAEDVTGKMLAGWDAAVAEEELKFTDEAAELALRKQAVDLVAVYLAQVPDDEPAPLAVEARMETSLVDPFSGEDLGIPLLGIVDLVTPTRDGASIVDYKTSSRSSPPFEISHEIQLTAYSYLFRALTGQQEAELQICSLVKTKKPKVERHAYASRTDQHLARFFSVVREYLDALDAGRFNYRPGWACGMCDYRGKHCAEWDNGTAERRTI